MRVASARTCIWLITLAMLAPAITAAQPPLAISTRSDTSTIGTPFEVYLETTDKDFTPEDIIDVQFESLAEETWNLTRGWHPLELKRDSPNEGARILWVARLQAFDWGDLEIPEVFVRYRSTDADSEAAGLTLTAPTINVPSSLADGGDENEDPAATQDTVNRELNEEGLYVVRPDSEKYPRDWGLILMIAGLAALALLVAIVLIRLYMRREKIFPEKFAAPPPPPGVWALQEIKRLRTSDLVKTGSGKELFTQSTDILRIYLGRRYKFDSLEMTSLQLNQKVNELDLASEFGDPIRELLDEADLAKFGRFEPPTDRRQGVWNDLRKIVIETTPAEEFEGKNAKAIEPESEEAA